jgi:hypothetical protein
MIRVGEISKGDALDCADGRGQAMRDTAAAIMACESERAESERAHDFELVGRHRTFRVVDAALAAIGFR